MTLRREAEEVVRWRRRRRRRMKRRRMRGSRGALGRWPWWIQAAAVRLARKVAVLEASSPLVLCLLP